MNQAPNLTSRADIICHRCGMRGHIRRDCRVKLGPDRGSKAATASSWRSPGHGQKANAAEARTPALPPPPPQRNTPKNA
jgi:hypothetical protein